MKLSKLTKTNPPPVGKMLVVYSPGYGFTLTIFDNKQFLDEDLYALKSPTHYAVLELEDDRNTSDQDTVYLQQSGIGG